MAYHDYKCLKIEVDRGVAFVNIDHPPMNLLDLDLVMDTDRFGQEVGKDDNIKVIVFDSADPDFFI